MSTHSIYLGGSDDPVPVFRDEAPDAFDWPEGAVMAVTFTAEAFPALGEHVRRQLPRAEFFAVDGWPVELPREHKHKLGKEMKREFQVFPWSWRSWTWDDCWRRAYNDQRSFARVRSHAALARGLAAAVVPLARELP